MNKILKVLFVIVLFTSCKIQAQVNIDSISNLNLNQMHVCELNDIWGYVDETGIEYALVGTTQGTSVVSLEDPTDPLEVFWKSGSGSIWRDLKTWEDYAYVTTEANDGLLIINLSPLPASNSLPTSSYFGPMGATWSSAHNLYIDSNGYAYIFGANRGNGGVIMLDVHTDPMNPIEVGMFDNWYVHDGYVRNDTMFLAHISDGFISMVDITDKANPVVLGVKSTPSDFSHNIWPSDDGKYAFTTDEVSSGYLGVYDMSDPAAIVELDRSQSSPGKGVIPHNTHFLNDYIITSYYSDGIRVHDVSQKNNIVEVGSFDTYPGQTTGYEGCWGAYPYLPSGLILASDRSYGLFVLNPNYTRACFLEGVVTSSLDASLIEGVEVTISGGIENDHSNSVGEYAIGTLEVGDYNVTYSRVGYYPRTLSVSLSSGVIVIQDVELDPIPPYLFQLQVIESGSGLPIEGAEIVLACTLLNHTGTTNSIGEEDFVLFYEEEYTITVGKWGYRTNCLNVYIDNMTGSYVVELLPMYYDDFSLDFGWTVEGDAETGVWERGSIDSTTYYAPYKDVDYDCGKFAFVTGNSPDPNSDVDDVDEGTTRLRSPIFDLTTYSSPYVHYSMWFFCFYGPAAVDDTLRISLSNGTDIVEIDKVGSFGVSNLNWMERSFLISDFITPTSSMQLIVETSDIGANINITEAGFDLFFIAEENQSSLKEIIKQDKLTVVPNPVLDQFQVFGIQEKQKVTIYSIQGELIFIAEVVDGTKIDLSKVKPGMYFLKSNNETVKFMKY
jgi:choice-of-anchor B domain-containing protein